jgi:hypothetical protein
LKNKKNENTKKLDTSFKQAGYSIDLTFSTVKIKRRRHNQIEEKKSKLWVVFSLPKAFN